MDFIIFHNTKISHRQECFGGIIKHNGQIFILNKEQYKFLTGIDKYTFYNQLNKKEKVIANNLIEKEILLKINRIKGEKIINKQY